MTQKTRQDMRVNLHFAITPVVNPFLSTSVSQTI
jgi:hypothetical protein